MQVGVYSMGEVVEVHVEVKRKSLHDFAGRYRGDELQRDLRVGQDVLGVAGALLDVGEDEGGPACRGDDTV